MCEERIVKTLCRMCDDRCGIDVHLDGDKITKIEGNKEHVWNRGRLCIKGSHGLEMFTSPQRLKHPLKRTEQGFVEIPLEQALDEIAEKIKGIQAKYGARAVGVWKGEAVGFAQQEELARRWIHAIGSPNYFSNDSACFASRWMGGGLVLGPQGFQADVDNAQCLIYWGQNPPNSHPNVTQQINRARERGARLIVIDVRFTQIARQADVFVQVRPGTDGAMALGIIRELIQNDWLDHEFIERYTLGFDRLKEYAQQFTYDYVAKETGCDAATLIPQIAREIRDSMPRTGIVVGNGFEHHENGVNSIRAVTCIDGLIGSVDQKGGKYLPVGLNLRYLPLYDEKPLKELEPLGADKFPVLYDFRHECHTMTLMNTILSGEPYPIKAIVMTAANPAITNPNSDKVKKALSSLELFVVRDLFLSETAQLADYVLPAASYLERSELVTHGLFHTVTLTNRVLPPPPGVQDEYQFFHDLAHRLGAGAYFPWKNEDELNAWLLEDTDITLEQLQKAPSGYQYAQPRYQKYREREAAGEPPFKTPSGKVEFVSAYLAGYGYPDLPVYIPPKTNQPDPDYPFALVTGARKLPFCHARGHNLPALSQALRSPEIEIHETDAHKLGVKEGDKVRVTSRIGSIVIPVHVAVADEIMPGVVQITHGWREANANCLTLDDTFDFLSGFPVMKSVPVRIEKEG